MQNGVAVAPKKIWQGGDVEHFRARPPPWARSSGHGEDQFRPAPGLTQAQGALAAREQAAGPCCTSCPCKLAPPPTEVGGKVASAEMMPKVSVVCPTMPSRHAFHPLLLASYQSQFWPNKELIVFDTGGPPSPTFTAVNDPSIRYHHDAGAMLTLGEKRNLLVSMSAGDIVANFDDDNLYSPDYLATLVPHLRSAGGTNDLVALSGGWTYLLPTAACNGRTGYFERVARRPGTGRGESFVHEKVLPPLPPLPPEEGGDPGRPPPPPRRALYKNTAAAEDAHVVQGRVVVAHCVDDDHGILLHIEVRSGAGGGSKKAATACAAWRAEDSPPALHASTARTRLVGRRARVCADSSAGRSVCD